MLLELDSQLPGHTLHLSSELGFRLMGRCHEKGHKLNEAMIRHAGWPQGSCRPCCRTTYLQLTLNDPGQQRREAMVAVLQLIKL